MDITSIAAAAQGIKAAVDIAQSIRTAGITLEAAEHKLKLAELISALADAKIAVASVQDQLTEKDAEINQLKSALDLKQALQRHKEAYFAVSEGGRPTGDPYCSHCFEVKHIAVHLNRGREPRTSYCPSCKNVYRRESVLPSPEEGA